MTTPEAAEWLDLDTETANPARRSDWRPDPDTDAETVAPDFPGALGRQR